MLTNYNRSIKYLILFLVAIPFSILLIKPLVTSSDRFIFVTIILIISLLVFWKPKKLFLFSVGGAILFYHPFLQGTLFYLGNAKVYSQDLLMTALTIYLVAQVIHKYRRDFFKLKSTWFFMVFFLWGLLSIVRGYPYYGFSAIGESRWYVLIILYYFFILFFFHHKSDVPWFLKWVSLFVSVMIIEHFVLFFFFNDNVARAGYLAFRFINATEALLVAYLFIFLFLFLLNPKKKIPNLLFYSISFILLSIIVVIQHRSVWLSTVGGIFAIYILSKKKWSKILTTIGLTIFILFTFAPFVSQFVGVNLYEALKKSAIFLQSPEEDPTASWRLTAWRQEIKKAKKNPIIGEGLGGYSEWFDGQNWSRVMVHNGYIMAFSKFGIVGVFLLFSGLFFWYKEMNQYERNENEPYYKFIGIGLQVAVFMHLIYTAFYDFTMFFWILLSLGSNMIINQNKLFLKKNRVY
jgi:O-antigen ligase